MRVIRNIISRTGQATPTGRTKSSRPDLSRTTTLARAADVGIAGGDGEGLLFRHGEILRKVPQDKLVDALMDEIDKL